ncbi:neutral/alkaline non-lysosomal ceramidase N-terminal domain-containing protein [Negadavirga shengliensis]|uniref:Neutral ceramidase n=1 Tax=Negadavirga shengliensis TaxID=1389218 RepID=A0ABV9T736_9BACT
MIKSYKSFFLPGLTRSMLCAVLGLLSFITPQLLPAQELKAAVTKVDITPENSQWLLGYGPRKSTGIHDRIYHRIVVMDDGSTRFCLVSSEICLVSPAEYDRIAERVHRELGISPQNLWWTVTHTHSAPEVGPPGLPEVFMGERYDHEWDRDYTALVEERMMEGIGQALDRLEPARLGTGWGFSQANINRRAIDEYGKASLGLNPDGPVDRKIGLIRLEKADGNPLALIANYAIHGTVLGQEHTEISGDAPGVVSSYVEEETGAPMLFINGAAGNLAPIYSVYPNPRAGHLNQFKVLLGDRILAVNKKITAASNNIKLETGAVTVTTPRKAGLSWPQSLRDYSHTDASGENHVLLPIRFLKINEEVAVWSAPLELFCEISNQVRDGSPFPYTFYYGYSNGWLGYLPTADAYNHGGYEVERVCAFTPEAEKDLIEGVLTYLKGWSKE